jgi:chromosome segregation ATPase
VILGLLILPFASPATGRLQSLSLRVRQPEETMGLLSFLTSSRLKAELTRQRDEIARMHQMLDIEVAQRQEAEKQGASQLLHLRSLEEEAESLRSSLDDDKASLDREREALQKQIAEERKKLQADAEDRVRDTDVLIATLRQELDEKQRQRTEVTEQNAKLAECYTQLEKRPNEMAASVQGCEESMRNLEEEKRELQKDLDKIMGNLTRW